MYNHGEAPTRAFSWLKAATTAFTFKTLLRHYAKWALIPRSLNVKLGPRHKSQNSLADAGVASTAGALGLVAREEAEVACVTHTDNSLKKITLVNCLIIIILIVVIAANINEGKIY